MADIVVIDDEPRYRRLIAQVLTGAGHQVRQAEDGAEGLATCLQRTPQLVITDIVMPGMEGIETILRLMRERPGVAVLAISGGEPPSLFLPPPPPLRAAGPLPEPLPGGEVLAGVGGFVS